VDEEEIMTTQQVASELKVTDARVRQLLADGKLSGEKIGRDWIVRRKHLNSYLRILQEEQANPTPRRGRRPKAV
jgi:excisionase family DNA binding protein